MGLFLLKYKDWCEQSKVICSRADDYNTLCQVFQYTWQTDANEFKLIYCIQASLERFINWTSHTITGSINPFPTLQAKHICNSHEPIHDQKLQKSLSSKPTERQGIIKHENTTHGIVHAGFSGIRAFVARKKVWCKLIVNRFVIPHDTIPSTLNYITT